MFYVRGPAASTIFIPILAASADASDLPSLLLLIPGTFACSLSFMFPNSTPPNAVAYGTGLLHVKEMVKYGFFINCIGIWWISVFTLTLGRWAFDF